jgi:CBS domain-containing protein
MSIALSTRMNEKLKTPVSRIITSPVVSVPRTLSVKEAVRVLLERRFTGVPVVDEKGRGVGVLTLRDVARYAEWHLESEEAAEDAQDAEIARELSRRNNLERSESRARGMHVDRMARARVEQIMTPRIATVKPDSTLGDVVRTFAELGVHRVFVGGKEGSIVGVVSTVDAVMTLSAGKTDGRRRTAKKR